MKARKYAFGGDVNSPDQMTPNTYPFASTPTNITLGSQPSNLGENMATTMGQYRKGGKVKGYAKGGETYRSPSAKESEKLERARELMQRGIEGEKDIMSRLLPTMAKSARDDKRAAKALRESVSESAREGEAYNQAGYAKGGKIDGCARRGKTRGRMV